MPCTCVYVRVSLGLLDSGGRRDTRSTRFRPFWSAWQSLHSWCYLSLQLFSGVLARCNDFNITNKVGWVPSFVGNAMASVHNVIGWQGGARLELMQTDLKRASKSGRILITFWVCWRSDVGTCSFLSAVETSHCLMGKTSLPSSQLHWCPPLNMKTCVLVSPIFLMLCMARKWQWCASFLRSISNCLVAILTRNGLCSGTGCLDCIL